MITFKSTDLEKLDIEEFESITEYCHFDYVMTEGEHAWLIWIGERYSISSYLLENCAEDDGKATITIETSEISDALSNDGVDRAPCLSEDTQLARLIWFIGPNQ